MNQNRYDISDKKSTLIKKSIDIALALKSIDDEAVEKPKPLFNEEEFRTEVIVPVMNIMGLGLSVFGNLFPLKQLRNGMSLVFSDKTDKTDKLWSDKTRYGVIDE